MTSATEAIEATMKGTEAIRSNAGITVIQKNA